MSRWSCCRCSDHYSLVEENVVWYASENPIDSNGSAALASNVPVESGSGMWITFCGWRGLGLNLHLAILFLTGALASNVWGIWVCYIGILLWAKYGLGMYWVTDPYCGHSSEFLTYFLDFVLTFNKSLPIKIIFKNSIFWLFQESIYQNKTKTEQNILFIWSFLTPFV